METRNLKRILLFGVVGSIVLVLIVSLTLITISLKSSPCDLVDEKPTFNQTTNVVEKFITEDYSAILTFSGYLQGKLDPYLKESPHDVYLPLKLNSISLSKDEDRQKLILHTNCAKITLLMQPDATSTNNNKTSVLLIRVELVQQSWAGFDLCETYEVGNMEVSLDKHYACNVEKWYNCFTIEDDYEILSLVIKNLEFQVGGDSLDIESGTFSTEPQYCE